MKLKACPFCSSVARIGKLTALKRDWSAKTGTKVKVQQWFAYCVVCGARSAISIESIKTATHNWNHRSKKKIVLSITDDQIIAWATRNAFEDSGLSALRCAFEDAASLLEADV